MKKVYVLVGIVIGLWVVFWFVPIFVNNPEENSTNFYTALFTAAGALFTGLAFAVAYGALYKQQEEMIKQMNLTTLSDSSCIMDKPKFVESRNYIYSKAFNGDIETVRHILNLENGEAVGLDDFKRVFLQNLHGNDVPISDELKEKLRVSYEKISYFCGKMEYFGVLYGDKLASTIFIEYYGKTITETYQKLRPIIEKTREGPKSEMMYKHYTLLYDSATKRK